VEGWAHVTTNGGKTWRPVLWTVRGQFVKYISHLEDRLGCRRKSLHQRRRHLLSNNGGQTWSVDVTTNAEMDACAEQPISSGYRVWCAGYDGSLTGYIYSLELK